MSRENVEIVRAAWDAWEHKDMDALFGFYDPEIVWDQTHYPATELAALYSGHDGVRRFFRAWLAPFESYWAHAEDIIDAGDAVLVRCRQGGRGKRSKAEVEMPVYWQVYRLRGGRVVRIEVYADDREGLEAAGLAE
jgi:ketosteroid isomerase-like protein